MSAASATALTALLPPAMAVEDSAPALATAAVDMAEIEVDVGGIKISYLEINIIIFNNILLCLLKKKIYYPKNGIILLSLANNNRKDLNYIIKIICFGLNKYFKIKK